MGQTYLSIQGSYQTLRVGLFDDEKLIDTVQEESVRSSSLFISMLESFLAANNIALQDLAFIAVDQGPGAFTSLRVTITYLNAISFAAHIPLVGVDGLAALAFQTQQFINKKQNLIQAPKAIATMLNAYGGEVYLGIYSLNMHPGAPTLEKLMEPTNLPVDDALTRLKELCGTDTIVISGNGAQLYAEDIQHSFTGNALMYADELPVCSVEQIAYEGHKIFNAGGDRAYKILPLYLKEQTFAVRKK